MISATSRSGEARLSGAAH